MKDSVKKEVHSGEQPIRVLKHNLTERLVERNETYINSLQFKLNKNIKYHIADLPLMEGQIPFIDKEGVINIHETYLSYVWIVCYSFFVLYEEGLAIPDCIKRNLPTSKPHNPELIPLAKELFDYGKSLVEISSSWDKDYFPNPEYFDEQTDEGWYILKTNDLYVEVINFILYHEIAHAEFEHIKKITISNLTNAEIKHLEIDADTRAIELILSSCKNRNLSELAIIVGFASLLFFNDNLDGGEKHPNIDTRLDNAIKIFNPTEDSSIWPFLALFFNGWSEQFSLGLTNKPVYNTYKELFYDFLNQMN